MAILENCGLEPEMAASQRQMHRPSSYAKLGRQDLPRNNCNNNTEGNTHFQVVRQRLQGSTEKLTLRFPSIYPTTSKRTALQPSPSRPIPTLYLSEGHEARRVPHGRGTVARQVSHGGPLQSLAGTEANAHPSPAALVLRPRVRVQVEARHVLWRDEASERACKLHSDGVA